MQSYAVLPQEILCSPHEGNYSINSFTTVLLPVFQKALRNSHISVYTNITLVWHYLTTITAITLGEGAHDTHSSFCSSVPAWQFHPGFSSPLLAQVEGLYSSPFISQKLPFHQAMTNRFLHSYRSSFLSVQSYWKFLSSLPTPLFHAITCYRRSHCTFSTHRLFSFH